METFPDRRPAKGWFSKAILIMAGIGAALLLDLGAGIAFQKVVGHTWSEHAILQKQQAERLYRTTSAVYHHDLKPNAAVPNANWGARSYGVATDSLGFKTTRPHTTPLTSDEYTVVLIGDSFTEGIGVEYPNTFAGIAASHFSSQGVRILNAGVATYSPIIYWRKAKHLLEEVNLHMDELVVFLDMSDVFNERYFYTLDDTGNVIDNTDGRQDVRRQLDAGQPVAAETRQPTLLQRTIVLSTAVAFASRWLKEYREPYALHKKASAWTSDQALYEEFAREGLRRMGHYMDELSQLARDHHVRLTVVIYPWPDQIAAAQVSNGYTNYWRAWAERQDVTLIDLFPAFVSPGDLRRNLDTLDRLFIPGDIHWNEAGHRFVAEQFIASYRTARQP